MSTSRQIISRSRFESDYRLHLLNKAFKVLYLWKPFFFGFGKWERMGEYRAVLHPKCTQFINKGIGYYSRAYLFDFAEHLSLRILPVVVSLLQGRSK